MCDKLPYQNPRIDKCLIDKIKKINDGETIINDVSTVASCCGHNRYLPTIVVRNKKTGELWEWFSGKKIEKRKKHRYYERDADGYYYLKQIYNKYTFENKEMIKILG